MIYYLACESMYILIEATNSRPIIVVLTYYPWTIVTISSSSNTLLAQNLFPSKANLWDRSMWHREPRKRWWQCNDDLKGIMLYLWFPPLIINMIALLSIFVTNLPSRWPLLYSSSDLSFVRIWSINALSSQQSCKATWLSAHLIMFFPFKI